MEPAKTMEYLGPLMSLENLFYALPAKKLLEVKAKYDAALVKGVISLLLIFLIKGIKPMNKKQSFQVNILWIKTMTLYSLIWLNT